MPSSQSLRSTRVEPDDFIESPSTGPATRHDDSSTGAGLAWPPTEADLALIEIVPFGPTDDRTILGSIAVDFGGTPRREFSLVPPPAVSEPADAMAVQGGIDHALTHNDVMAPFDWLAALTPTPARASGQESDTPETASAGPDPSVPSVAPTASVPESGQRGAARVPHADDPAEATAADVDTSSPLATDAGSISLAPPLRVAARADVDESAGPNLDQLDAQLAALLALVGRGPGELEPSRHRPTPSTDQVPAPPSVQTSPDVERVTAPAADPVGPALASGKAPALGLTSLAEDLAALEADVPVVSRRVQRQQPSTPTPSPSPAAAPTAAALAEPPPVVAPVVPSPVVAKAAPVADRAPEAPADTTGVTSPPVGGPPAGRVAPGTAVVARAPVVGAPAGGPSVDTSVPAPVSKVTLPVAKAPVAVPAPPVETGRPLTTPDPAARPAGQRRAPSQASGPWVAAAAVLGVIGAAAFGATHLARWQEKWFGSDDTDAGTASEPKQTANQASSGTPLEPPAVERSPGGSADTTPLPEPPRAAPPRDMARGTSETASPRSTRRYQATSARVPQPAAAMPVTRAMPDSAARVPVEPVQPVAGAVEEVEETERPAASGRAFDPPVPPTPDNEESEPAVSPEQVEQQLYQAVALYMRAYSNLDPGAVRRVWPGADTEALRLAFEPLKAVRLGIDRCEIAVDGSMATASCPGRAMYLLKDGGPEPQVEEHQWRFTFRHLRGAWRIEDVVVY